MEQGARSKDRDNGENLIRRKFFGLALSALLLALCLPGRRRRVGSDRIQPFSATRRAAPAAVEFHGPAAERYVHWYFDRLLEGRGLAGRHDLAVHRRRFVDVG